MQLPVNNVVLLALGETQVAGCVMVQPVEDGVTEMRRLYVRPALRGQGIGLALMQAAIDAARKAGYHTVRLETLEAMEAARALFRRLGFIEASPWHPPHTDHDKTLFMTLKT